MEIEEQLEITKRGCNELLIEAEFVEKLRKGRPLRVKAGLIRRRLIFILGIRF
jgi:tyrosyl-tRNA synthetase